MFWFFVFLIAGLCILFFGLAIGREMLNKRKLMLGLKPWHAGMSGDGPTVAEGRAVALKKHRAPFCNEDVVYCESRAGCLQMENDKVKANAWTTEPIYESKIDDPFIVRTSTGLVLVDPSDAFVDNEHYYMKENYRRRGGSIETIPPGDNILNAFEEASIRWKDHNGPLPLEFNESYVKSGEKITVLGERITDPKAIREALGDVILKEGVKVSALLRDGIGKEKLFIKPGTRANAISSLFKKGLVTCIVSLVVGVLSLGISGVIWLVVNS